MAFRDIVDKIGSGGSQYAWPAGASNRYKRLDAYERLLNGTIYDHLPNPFDLEKSGANKYVPLLERRPSIKYGLAKIVVDQHAAMTFGEAHFPHVRCVQPMSDVQTESQKTTEAACAALIKFMNLPAVMQSALRAGSVGSCAMIAKIRNDMTPLIDIVPGKNALPKINVENWSKMDGLDRIWAVDGETLSLFGYEIDKKNFADTYWLRNSIDGRDWVWFLPLRDEDYRDLGNTNKNGETIEWQIDTSRSGVHGFSEAPVVWLRNLLVGDDAIDGPCTFAEIADICVAVDYLLSQSARGLRFSMDPLLVIKTGEMGQASLDLARASGNGDIAKPTGVLPLMGEDADASLLEITGKGFESSQQFIKQLREYALEVAGGLKSDSDNSTGPQSGRALELFYQVVVFFIERLRVSYGDEGLLPMLRLLLQALKEGAIDLHDGVDWSGIDLNTPLTLVWPRWWAPRGSDLQAELQALQLAAGGSVKNPITLLDPELVSRIVAQNLDLDDAASVAADAKKIRDEKDAQAQAMQQAVKEVQSGEADSETK